MLRLKSVPLYILDMSRNSRGRPVNAPPGFIHPCRPIVAQRPPSGPTWVHELKHDGYRLQIHVRNGRVRLFTMNGANWTNRYPLIVEEAAKLNVSAIMDAEVICTDGKGIPDFDRLHSRTNDHLAFACAFDLLMVGDQDLRRLPLAKRKVALRRLLKAERGRIQYVEHTEGDGDKMFEAVCKLGLEGMVSKRSGSFYRSERHN
jgi:bifunctional non-homologous end joining protein LigD